MRLSIVLLITATTFLISCVTEGDKIYNSYNYFPEDSTGDNDSTGTEFVQIVSPTSNQVFEVWYDWVPYPYYQSCEWGYQADTVYFAEVTTTIEEPITEARVFVRTSPSGGFNQYSVEQFPGQEHFFVRIFNFNVQFTQNISPELDGAFWVSLTTSDSTNYISQTVPFRIESRVHYDMATVPVAPVADTLIENSYQQRMLIEWCRQSPNSDSFHVAIRRDQTGHVARVNMSTEYYGQMEYTDYLPVSDYSVWISASNEYGESAASDTMRLTTHEPLPPGDLAATTYANHDIILSWWNRSLPDSILIGRRDTLNGWATIDALECQAPYCTGNYTDTTTVQGTIYYYRLGGSFENGVWWYADSVGVWAP